MTLIEYILAVANKPENSNLRSIAIGIETGADILDLSPRHRMAQYLAQLMHESVAGRYDREIASGAAYEGRRDLGNTETGDGVRFKGHGPIQVTGRANHREYARWARDHFPELDPADFERFPEQINTDPWEGLSGIWYWSTRGLNRYADAGNIEMITRRINGGLNGFADRVQWYERAAMIGLGYGTGKDEIRRAQNALKVVPDGIVGPVTRAALHEALRAAPGWRLSEDSQPVPGPAEGPPADPMQGAAPTPDQIRALVACRNALTVIHTRSGEALAATDQPINQE